MDYGKIILKLPVLVDMVMTVLDFTTCVEAHGLRSYRLLKE